MSLFKVPVTTIKEIKPHNNSDNLCIYQVYGFEIIGRKFQYQLNQEVLYIPIDSILPQQVENKIFSPDSKVKLNKHRVRQIKLRGIASQGLLVEPQLLGIDNPELEKDYSEELGIKKYEPPELIQKQNTQLQKRDKPLTNPLFHGYNGIENLKWYPDLFVENEEVIIQEKLHGTNSRAGYLPTSANTLKKKILKFLGLLPKYEYCYGSNNVELTNRKNFKGFYGGDIYGACLEKEKVFDKLQKNELVYGEIIGPSIQKNYEYGLKEHRFVLFDVKILQPDNTYKWLNPEEVEHYAKERGFNFVPVLYRGPFVKEQAKELVKGDSVYSPLQKVREGIVIKSRFEYNDNRMPSNKKVVKWISEDYLSKEQTEFH